MPEHGDYLPTKEAELIDWLDNFVEKVRANAAKWQIPADEVTETAARHGPEPRRGAARITSLKIPS